MKQWQRCVIGIGTALLLFGCKADLVEIVVKTKDLKEAIAGDQVAVEFEAEFSLIAEYDDEMKGQMNALEKSVENYISLEEFDVSEGDFGLTITIEGEIPLLYASNGEIPKDIESPWALVISDNQDGGSLSGYPYKLTVATTSRFSAFEGELQNINFMLSPEEFQPIKFKLRASKDDQLKIFTGAVQVGGESRVVYETEIPKRMTLTMKGGVYDKTSQVIYFSIR
jgi:hypothetical protein